MEGIEYLKKNKQLPIVPFYGNDFIYIGMSLKELNDILWDYYLPHQTHTSGVYLMLRIILDDCICVRIDVVKQVVYAVDFIGSYKGKYQEKIGIGSTVSELQEFRDDVSFDEEYVMIGNHPYDLIFKINNQSKTIYSLDEVRNNTITEI